MPLLIMTASAFWFSGSGNCTRSPLASTEKSAASGRDRRIPAAIAARLVPLSEAKMILFISSIPFSYTFIIRCPAAFSRRFIIACPRFGVSKLSE